MLMVGFRGPRLESADPITASLSSGRLGNVVLFDTNIAGGPQSGAQLSALDQQLQSLAARRLLIAADEEGGLVARLRPATGFPATVSAAYLGQLNDPQQTHDYAAELAGTLAGVGINLNLAPVVDLNLNPANPVIGGLGRSFSANPDVVTQQALAFIAAHHERGVLCTLKHFPGHGSSRADSHLGFVDVTDLWVEAELQPFARIVAAGQADAIMTAHIFNSRLDPNYPATLSRATITGVLRQQLGYDGVVLTDDMQMGAISQRYGFEQAIELAINAGADVISIANNTAFNAGAAEQAFDVILAAIEAGRVPEERIHESFRRISRLKAKLA
jgi:beta-N-acetylhexosaminidase